MRSTKLPSWIESLLGLGPVAPPPHAFRIDGSCVEYAGFERRGGQSGGGSGAGLALVRTASVPLDPDTFQEGLLGGPAREPADLQGRIAELLQGLGDGVDEASLVLPDAWLRLAFTDVAHLPTGVQERDDVLRWKLKRLVPFRVEELRLSGVEIEPLPVQSAEEPHRMLLGFGVDALLTQLEEAFAALGVRIGAITSDSLALLAALSAAGGAGGVGTANPERPGEAGMAALALVGDAGYTLVFSRRGEPVLHRYKGFAGSLPEAARGSLVKRDLRLTRTFLEDSFPGMHLDRVVLARPWDGGGHDSAFQAAQEPRDPWLSWLGDSLESRAERLRRDDLPLTEVAGRGVDWHRLAPLVGAVSQEVAA